MIVVDVGWSSQFSSTMFDDDDDGDGDIGGILLVYFLFVFLHCCYLEAKHGPELYCSQHKRYNSHEENILYADKPTHTQTNLCGVYSHTEAADIGHTHT